METGGAGSDKEDDGWGRGGGSGAAWVRPLLPERLAVEQRRGRRVCPPALPLAQTCREEGDDTLARKQRGPCVVERGGHADTLVEGGAFSVWPACGAFGVQVPARYKLLWRS